MGLSTGPVCVRLLCDVREPPADSVEEERSTRDVTFCACMNETLVRDRLSHCIRMGSGDVAVWATVHRSSRGTCNMPNTRKIAKIKLVRALVDSLVERSEDGLR